MHDILYLRFERVCFSCRFICWQYKQGVALKAIFWGNCNYKLMEYLKIENVNIAQEIRDEDNSRQVSVHI